jgi:hypothetical protein
MYGMKEALKIGYFCSSEVETDPSYLNADLVLVSSKAFPTLCYKRELSGNDENIYRMGRFALKFSAPVIIAVKSENFGSLRRSAVVFQDGKLLAVVDAATPFDKTEAPSFGYSVIKTKVGKIGIALSKDVADTDCLKALTLCQSELIINPYADIYDFSLLNLMPTVSYITGLPTVALGDGQCVSCSANGKIVYSSKKQIGAFILPTKRVMRKKTINTFSN